MTRWRLKANPMPRGRVLAARARHRDDDDRRLLPLELVHRSDANAVGHALAQPSHLRVVRRDDEEVVEAERARRRRFVGERRPEERAIAAATASASSHEDWLRPSCSGWSRTSPSPAASVRRALTSAGSEPPLVVRLGRERADLRTQAPGVLEEDPALRRHGLVLAEQVLRAPTPSPPPAARPARPAAAGSGRRGRRGCARPSRPRSRRRATTWPASSTKSVSTKPSNSSRAKSQAVPATSWSSVVEQIPPAVGAVDELAPRSATPRCRRSTSCGLVKTKPCSRASRSISWRSLWIALWLSDVTPTRLPVAHQRDRHLRALPCLAGARRALHEEVAVLDRGDAPRPAEGRAALAGARARARRAQRRRRARRRGTRARAATAPRAAPCRGSAARE